MDGKSQLIGRDRALVLDVIHCASKVPSFPVERMMDVGAIDAARQRIQPRISWTAVFCRAYGLASRDHSQLRQMYLAWPLPRMFQSPQCVIAIAVNRQMQAGERLFFGRVFDPDRRSLRDIQQDLDRFQTADPSTAFRSQWRAAMLPKWIRRLAWWWRMDVDHKNRARRVGTGSISALAGQGVTNRLHPCMMTSSLSFGPVEKGGKCLVTLQCDHRILDGAAAARALNGIEQSLNDQVLRELQQLIPAGTPSQSRVA